MQQNFNFSLSPVKADVTLQNKKLSKSLEQQRALVLSRKKKTEREKER